PTSGGNERKHEYEQAGDHGAARGNDGLGGAGHGDAHGLATVVGEAQFVAITGDEQERVVGARAKDQHGQNAYRRLVPRNAHHGENTGGKHGGGLIRDAHHG